MAFPWRICLAGGWLDQPWVSKLCAGPVIVVNIRPHPQFKTRSGLATSTRALGIELWGTMAGGAPPADVAPERLARLLFNVENPVGCTYVSGSQDALGLMLPGINRLDYAGDYWPASTEHLASPESQAWLQRVLWLVPLPSRPPGYDPLARQNITFAGVRRLADASEDAWAAIVERDAARLGSALSHTMGAWKELLPETVPDDLESECADYMRRHHGCLFSGAGGGFLLVIADEGAHVKGGFQVEITTRRSTTAAAAPAGSPGAKVSAAATSSSGRHPVAATALSDLLGQLLIGLCLMLLLILGGRVMWLRV